MGSPSSSVSRGGPGPWWLDGQQLGAVLVAIVATAGVKRDAYCARSSDACAAGERCCSSPSAVFSAELVAAATCCVRCYRSMPSPCRGVKSIRLRSYARIACSLDSLDSPQPPFRLRQPSPPPTSPPAGAARHDSEASGLNPHLDKVVVRRRRHIGVQIPPTPGRRQPPRPQLTTAARRCPRRPWRTISGRREAAPYPT